jgi:RNA polymerase sigma-70 factor (ECF subfamily)
MLNQREGPAMSDNQSTILQQHLDRLQGGDLSARDALLRQAAGNLQRLVRRMLGDYPGVRRWEDADDVGQNAALRLWKALEEVRPATARDFYRLAALQVRRELLDLARHYSGPHGLGANHDSVPHRDDASPRLPEPGTSTLDPGRLAQWTDFHRQVDELPAPLREVFDLLYYQDLPQAEAAALLEVSEPTLRRRWLEARLLLQEKMKSEPPG